MNILRRLVWTIAFFPLMAVWFIATVTWWILTGKPGGPLEPWMDKARAIIAPTPQANL